MIDRSGRAHGGRCAHVCIRAHGAAKWKREVALDAAGQVRDGDSLLRSIGSVMLSGGFREREMIDLDYLDLKVDCPRCGFSNGFRFRQARLRDVIICRGCHRNISLDDSLNTCRKARAQIQRAMDALVSSLNSIGDIVIKL